MNLNLDSLITESLGVADAISSGAIPALNRVTETQNEITTARINLASEAANASEVKVQAELGEVARQEAIRKSIAARLGTDASLAGWVIGKKGEEILAADAGMAEASAAIAAKDSVSFLDNPIAWLTNQFTVNEDITRYNFWAQQKDRATETAKQVTELTTGAIQVNNALSATTSEAYIGAMRVIGAHQYNQNALEAAAQGARWNMEGIVAATNASRDRLSVLYSANNAMMQQKQWQAEMARLQIARSEHNMRMEAAREKKDEDSLITSYIQNGYFNFTGKQMDPVSTKNALILFKAKQPDVMAFFESGLASSKVTNGQGNKPIISLSPYEASTYIGQGKVTNMSPAMNQVGEQLITWRRQFENPAVQSAYPYDAKDKKSKEVAFNKFVQDQRRGLQANISSDSVFAPYPIDKVAQLNKNIAATPLWNNVLKPAAATGVDINDPNIAFGIVTAAMREGKVSYADALDLSLMYAAGLDLNNQTRNFIAFGLAPAMTYNTSIQVPGTAGKTTINLADGKALATALNKAEAINAQYRMQKNPSTDMRAMTPRE
jgi:hypothetical protein